MNKIISFTFAANYNSLNELLTYLANLLQITFEARDSSYSGNYQKAHFDNGTIMVYPNFNESENEWKYEEYKDCKYLIGVRIEKGKKVERVEKENFFEDAFSKKGFKLVFRAETPVNS